MRNVGKPLPANIYQLISYVEYNILDEQPNQTATKRKPQAERAKVLRETRLIPKVILAIENFNKHIILLSKKFKSYDRLANYLHFGAVRDFNIQSGDLRAVIERTYSHSSQIEVSDNNLDADEEHSNSDDALPVEEDEVDYDQQEREREQKQEQEQKKKPKQQKTREQKKVPSEKQQETTRRNQRRRHVDEAEESQPKRRRGRSNKEDA